MPETPNTERAGYRRGNAPLAKIASKAVLSVPNDSLRWYEHDPISVSDDFARHKIAEFSGFYLGIYCCGLLGRQIPVQEARRSHISTRILKKSPIFMKKKVLFFNPVDL